MKPADIVPSKPVVDPPQRTELLVELPAGCNTPDGMALLPDGSILLSMPNFNDLEAGALLVT